jgi:DNA-binding MarR family transcriptional regulator
MGNQRACSGSNRSEHVTIRKSRSRDEIDKTIRIAAAYVHKYPWGSRQAIEICFRVESAAAALVNASHDLQKSLGLEVSAGRAAVLRALFFSRTQAMSQVEIGSETNVTPANVTYQVDTLEKAGLVARGPHPSDRRITLVELTDKGRGVCENLFPARTLMLTRAGDAFSDQEASRFLELLEKFERHLATLQTTDLSEASSPGTQPADVTS